MIGLEENYHLEKTFYTASSTFSCPMFGWALFLLAMIGLLLSLSANIFKSIFVAAGLVTLIQVT
jgi:hypothetical protein